MRRSRLGSLFLLLCLAAPVAALPAPEAPLGQDGPPDITAEELLRRQREEPRSLAVLDVRTAAEYAEGHVPGAINISHDELAGRIAEVRDLGDVDLVLYCRSGYRAGIAAELLDRAGLGRLLHLEGDMLGWLEKELPVETGDPDSGDRDSGAVH